MSRAVRLPRTARLILLPLLLLAAGAAQAIEWQEINLQGRLLLGKMKIGVSWSCVTSEQAQAGLYQLADNSLEPSGQVVKVVLETSALGSERTNILWLDRDLGYAVLQRERIRIKSRSPNYKVERYSFDSMTRMERTPESRKEKKGAYKDWSNEFTESFEFYGDHDDEVMTEPHALFFLLAVSDIKEPGDRQTYRIYAGNRVLLMEFVAVEWQEPLIKEVLVVTADANTRTEDANAEPYKWFGMRGVITLKLAAKSRSIFGMSGRTRVGRINLELGSSVDADVGNCVSTGDTL